jgi:Domain of unknown function (DUF4388)
VRLEGSLDAFSLPDIFSLLSMTKKTGGLHLRRADAHGVVWMGDGLITGAASDLSRLSLGRRIAGSGKVDDESLSAAVDSVTDNPEIGLAKALNDAEAIDDDELKTLVAEHLVDAVFDLMRWTDGVFEFVADEANIDDVGVVRSVEDVVTEARQRLEAWAEIDEHVAAVGTVLSLALEPDTDPTLQRDEWALVALVDGRRTVEDVVNLCGRGEFAVVMALADLVDRGLLRADDQDGLAALQRRQDLVGSLETTSPVEDLIDDPTDEHVEQPPSPPRMSIAEQVKASLAEDDDEDEDPSDEPQDSVEPAEAADPADDDADVVVDEAADDNDQPEAAADADADTDDDPADDAEPDTSGGNPVSQIGSRAQGSAGRDTARVTPQRPEPFLPTRAPEHPEPLAAVAAAGGGGVAAMPAGAIERDPSVNKSLLLRLIAGVRGL